MYNIIQKKKLWYSISSILVGVSIIATLLWGLRLGIDFTGGSLMEVNYSQARPSIDQMETAFKELGINNVKVQPSGDLDFILRYENVDQAKHQEITAKISNINIENVNVNDNKLTENRFESIGPTIGNELKQKAIQAIILVLVCILLYIAYAFRQVSRPVQSWKYGLAAIIALVHDIAIVIGLFAFLGKFLNVEVDSLFVTALLTVLGFSIHDTIVTFDRIRENLFKTRNYDNFESLINTSINETIVRSVNTSLTTFMALLAVYIFGGVSTKYFVLALMLGILVGTYSSIFIASPLLLFFNKKK